VNRVLHVLFLALVAAVIAQALWQHAACRSAWRPLQCRRRGERLDDTDGQTAAHIGIVLFIATMLEGIAWLSPASP